MNTEKSFVLGPSSDLTNKSPKPSTSGATSQVTLEGVKNFANVCRICATVTELVIPIFNGEGHHHNLIDKIHKHLPIQVSEHDVLPRVLCYQCASTLLAWHELYHCCQQADAAFRQKLEISKQSGTQTNQNDNQKFSQDCQYETKSLNNSIVQLKNEAGGTNDAASVIIPMRLCIFCNTEQPVHLYKNHMISHHKDHIFRCEECHNFVDRKDIIIHMSLHAAEHMNETQVIQLFKRVGKFDLNVEKLFPDTKKCEAVKKPIAKDVTSEVVEPESHISAINVKTEKIVKKVSQDNEFSDHSDAEFFCQLPESVFEAIEDSRDTQAVENKIAIATKPSISDAKNETSQETSNLNENKQKKARACPICAKIYTAPSSYFYHLKQHNNVKEHECQFCGRRFGSKACLSEHITIHTGESSLRCQECDKSFRSKASLYIHKQIHNGIKPYSCRDCPLTFRWRTQLRRHEKRHKEEKAHVCSTCGRGFKIHYDLLRHTKTHAAGKYQCDKCHIKFAQIRYLKVHILKKHPPN